VNLFCFAACVVRKTGVFPSAPLNLAPVIAEYTKMILGIKFFLVFRKYRETPHHKFAPGE
jgi:hypothetical protein